MILLEKKIVSIRERDKDDIKKCSIINLPFFDTFFVTIWRKPVGRSGHRIMMVRRLSSCVSCTTQSEASGNSRSSDRVYLVWDTGLRGAVNKNTHAVLIDHGAAGAFHNQVTRFLASTLDRGFEMNCCPSRLDRIFTNHR